MKIDLYAKKIGCDGAVFLNTVEVPDNLGDLYEIPVKQQASMMSSAETASTFNNSYMQKRTFRHMHNPLQKLLGQNKAYVEI